MARSANGWVKVHRRAVEGDIGKNVTCLGIWTKFIAMANLSPTTIRWHGRPRELPRGALVLSIRGFAEDSGIHRETLMKHLTYLSDRDSIVIEKSPEGTMITLKNFDQHQIGESKTSHGTSTDTDHDTSHGTSTTCPPIKNIRTKELKNIITPSPKKSVLGAVECFASDFDIKELLETVSQDVQLKWLKAYSDPEWLSREFLKASAWISANPRKAPKNITRFLGNWLSKGFESYRKTLPSNSIGSVLTPEDRAEMNARKTVNQ